MRVTVDKFGEVDVGGVVERGQAASQLHAPCLSQPVVDGRLRGQDGIGGLGKR